MCLCVNSSSSSGLKRYYFLLLHVCLMKGEYDDKLSWPFCGNVVVQMMNQNPGCHHREITVRFDNDPTSSLGREKVTSGDIAVNGCYVKINQRVVDDQYCLKFRVVGVELCFENPKPQSV